MITYSTEYLKDIIWELEPLLLEHYKEVHAFPEKIPFNPNYDLYYKMESEGLTHTLTVREDGVLVGYIVTFLHPNLHYKDHIYAVNDVIFLSPHLRHTGIGNKMLQEAERIYRQRGASVITYHMKVMKPFRDLCESEGLEHKEDIFMKYIGE